MKVEVKNGKEIIIGKTFRRFSAEHEVPFFVEDIKQLCFKPFADTKYKYSVLISTFLTDDKDSPKMFWGQTKDYAGITEDFFKRYFKGKNKAYAIEIKRCIQYQRPIELNKIGVKRAPQSFMYLK